MLFLFYQQDGRAQQCSPENITAKYWQYRKNFNEHFVMNDRSPNGCVGNGITRTESDLTNLNCETDLLHGYGLPATSIIQQPSGSWGMGIRNESGNEFYDPACADAGPSPGINWNPPGPGHNPPFTTGSHNVLEYGSETPHQLAWYLITLATEYEMLRVNGQEEEQQRTLEEIFLALQAYRRLDITANCLVKQRYDEIAAAFEVSPTPPASYSCLCMPKYQNPQCAGADWKWDFDHHCYGTCPWSPDLSGYSGFSLRADATQEQESLNDFSEDKWNVDLVGSSFAMSQAPPCSTAFSQTCYLEKQTSFVSSDQIYVMMMGLAMVKRYVPAAATITTCDGKVYHPLDIAKNIAKGMVELPENTKRSIFWPGSTDDDCCQKAVKFGECAGGNFRFLYAGLEYMYNYICPEDKHNVGVIDRLGWGVLGATQLNTGNGVFYQEATAIGFDLGTYSTSNVRNKVINACMTRDKQILLLMNDLLYPAAPNVANTEARKAMFQSMLCSAPCGGTCAKPANYDAVRAAGALANPQVTWPEFTCPNTPGWTGQRWEGPGDPVDWSSDWMQLGRQFNGLDFMALYNMYMLEFPEERAPFYNPDRPEPLITGHLLGEDQITGPTTLCPGQTGTYSLNLDLRPPAFFQDLLWTSSSNINLSSNTNNPTNATMVTAPSPSQSSFINASFQEVFQKTQYYNGAIQQTGTPPVPAVILDVCDLEFRKPILSSPTDYLIELDMEPCTYLFMANAIGPVLPNASYHWSAVNPANGWSMTGTGPSFDFGNLIPPPHHNGGNNGTIEITVVIQTPCGNFTKTIYAHYTVCQDGYQSPQVRLSPNPAQNLISVRIAASETADFITTDPNGVRIRIYPASGGTNTLMDTYLYNNGQYFNISSLPNGVYQVRATASDLAPIQANLSIVR